MRIILFLMLFILIMIPGFSCRKAEKEACVSTVRVSDISLHSVIATGTILDLGNGITDYGFCWSKNHDPEIENNRNNLGSRDKLGEYTSTITNLDSSTIYYLRAYGVSDKIAVYGKEIPFTTIQLAILATTAATSITATTAISGGNITSEGGSPVTEKGVCWSTSTNPSISDSKTIDGGGSGSFTSILTDLKPVTTYYVRAYATNQVGTVYGTVVSFSTLGQIPLVVTLSATNMESNSATLHGNVNPNYLSSIVTFEYGVSTSYEQTAMAFQSPVTGNSILNVSVDISGLISGTTYHFRIKAVNELGPAYGSDMTFIAGTIIDIDGNTYKTVKIGTQTWMAENLKTTLFNDGTLIPYVLDKSIWQNSDTPAYIWYNYDKQSFKEPYGALYNWYAVNTGKLCFNGWHVPSRDDWAILIEYLGGENNAAGKLKEADTLHWMSPNIAATNESGFTALPGGLRNEIGIFSNITLNGYWWSSTGASFPATNASYLMLWYDANYVSAYSYLHYKNCGASIRCLKDN